MYLVEIKLGPYKIRRYILDNEALEKLIKENPQYEYVKIIKEAQTDKPKTKVKEKQNG